MNYAAASVVRRPPVFASILLALLVAAPLLFLAFSWFDPQPEIWAHLAENLLGELISNTLLLLIGVAISVLVLGVGLAWLVVFYDFPGKKYLDWGLMLPLAIPAYVLGFVILGLTDYSSPLQTFANQMAGHFVQLPDFRNLPGVVLVMSLVLYPYVYMLARSAFLKQGAAPLEAAQMLGMSRNKAIFKIAIPMARPAIVAGTSLALMETLADFGTVAVFNFDTFTTAIYKAWFGLFSLSAAAQLATLLILVVFLTLSGERLLRGKADFRQQGRPVIPVKLSGKYAFLASASACLVLLLAFILPVIQLLVWGWSNIEQQLDSSYWSLLRNTISLGVMSAIVCLLAGLTLAFAGRNNAWQQQLITRIAALGYALPGSVLAVGVMLSFTQLDNWIGKSLLTGSLLALLAGYLVRFLAVAHGPLEAGLASIRPSIPEAARSLGATSSERMRQIWLPLLKPGLFTAMLLVVVDVMKEMPATLLLRPFGYDTLAVRIYELTSEGEWEMAALPAITLILVGLLPVIILVRKSAKAAQQSSSPLPSTAAEQTDPQGLPQAI
ncbi:ABC transporter permease [Pelagibaculum spongiae]|uniref:ABC transporter permease n=1 Tax=Pelagibaculum spongiae TaxID=2080658 RepID=A0A2V1GXT3_9GAMM|nr:iron ABC transporter permease [Pelagibaculum spongiae]PVZ66322.1 ABC transporter permease [Pelagibaculum spongiae]